MKQRKRKPALTSDFGTPEREDLPATDWYAVMSRPQFEFVAADDLRRIGYHCWVPYQEVRKKRFIPSRRVYAVDWRQEALFKRYLFVRVEPGQGFAAVNASHAVSTLIYFDDAPLAIPHPVMTELMARGDVSGCVGRVDQTNRRLFEPRQKVTFIDDSPFAGLVGAVSVDNGPNVSIWLQVLGERREITVEPSLLKSIK